MNYFYSLSFAVFFKHNFQGFFSNIIISSNQLVLRILSFSLATSCSTKKKYFLVQSVVLSFLSLVFSILLSSPLFIVTKLEVLFVDRSYCQEVSYFTLHNIKGIVARDRRCCGWKDIYYIKNQRRETFFGNTVPLKNCTFKLNVQNATDILKNRQSLCLLTMPYPTINEFSSTRSRETLPFSCTGKWKTNVSFIYNSLIFYFCPGSPRFKEFL